jgi:hypothetical protein
MQTEHIEDDSEHIIEDMPSRNIDVENDKFPYCIVWTPIPLITWMLPFVGHMGIANSEGVIYDFAGPYFVSIDDFSFGRPTRYIQLDPSKTRKDWDEIVEKGKDYYCTRMVSYLTTLTLSITFSVIIVTTLLLTC